MDKLFEDKFMDTPHHFYFTIENPSNEYISFAFKARNFVIYYSSTAEVIFNKYSIPEVFYFTNRYVIAPHQSLIIKASLTFQGNNIYPERGYYITSVETGRSPEPFYWPENNNFRIKLYCWNFVIFFNEKKK